MRPCSSAGQEVGWPGGCCLGQGEVRLPPGGHVSLSTAPVPAATGSIYHNALAGSGGPGPLVTAVGLCRLWASLSSAKPKRPEEDQDPGYQRKHSSKSAHLGRAILPQSLKPVPPRPPVGMESHDGGKIVPASGCSGGGPANPAWLGLFGLPLNDRWGRTLQQCDHL